MGNDLPEQCIGCLHRLELWCEGGGEREMEGGKSGKVQDPCLLQIGRAQIVQCKDKRNVQKFLRFEQELFYAYFLRYVHYEEERKTSQGCRKRKEEYKGFSPIVAEMPLTLLQFAQKLVFSSLLTLSIPLGLELSHFVVMYHVR